MPRRSSTGPDPNVTAFNVVRQATNEHPVGQDRLAALIREVAGGLDAGQTPEALAERLWPAFRDAVASAAAERDDDLFEGFERLQDTRHSTAAAALGSKGGRKGGNTRAKKLSPERRVEIAKKAAAARWNKP